MTLRSAAPAVALSALLLLTACGGDDTDADPDPTPSERETAEPEDELPGEDDLAEALLTLRDVRDLGDLEEVDVVESNLSSDDMVGGDEACADFLDDEYGVEEDVKAQTEFEGTDVAGAEVSVYSTIEYYRDGGAEEELDAIRDVFRDCESFMLGGSAIDVEVTAQMIDLHELEGYDLGDEGVAIDLTFRDPDGNQLLRQGYSLIRVGDFLTISGGATTSESLGDDIMLTISEAAADRLEELVDDLA